MTVRRILTVDSDMTTLKQVSAPVTAVDDELRRLMDDMLETMYAAPGIGLAAIQIGEPVRVIVMDLAKMGEPPAPRFFVNPEIVSASEETGPWEEGCLSVPDIYEDVERPIRVRLRYLDYSGVAVEEDADETLRRVLSTKWTTSTGCCSSTTCRASSASGHWPRSRRPPAPTPDAICALLVYAGQGDKPRHAPRFPRHARLRRPHPRRADRRRA